MMKYKYSKEKTNQCVRLFLLILISNGFFYLLFMPKDGGDTKDRSEKPLQIHLGYKKIKIPLQVFTSLPSGKNEYPVSIYNSRNQLLIKRAFLHPAKQNQENAKSWRFDSDSEETSSLWEIEIPSSMLFKIIKGDSKIFKVFPYYKDLKPEENFKSLKDEPYEIIF